MKLIFAELAWEDDLYWQKQDRKMVERINKLIEATAREPFAGIGKPEPLKHAFDLPPINRTSHFSKKFIYPENDGHENR